MKVSSQLIKSFFEHTCTVEEAKLVAEYLLENPSAAENYISKSEWDSVSAFSSESKEFWESQWEAIEKKRLKSRRIIPVIIKVAAAAMIIIMAAAGIYRWSFSNRDINLAKHFSSVTDEMQVAENKHNEIQLLTLSDGSRIELMPGSKLNFKKNFEENKREIYLEGEAVFQVAKDSSRPFTVYSGSLSTTALGTRFSVKYSERNGDVLVHLYEGKVVIQAFHKDKIQKAYLLPGDEVSYVNSRGMQVERGQELVAGKKTLSPGTNTVRPGIKDSQAYPNQNNLRQQTSIIIPMWYRFDKESLPNVFDQLADIYKVKITYQKGELTNKYFIGKFEDTRSLRDILEMIAELNDLKVEKVTTAHYVIKRK